MTRLDKLLSISSEALGPKIGELPTLLISYDLGPQVLELLTGKNGFYTFEQALHVFPLSSDVTGTMTLEEWNSETLWRGAYGGLAEGILFFAEDIFGDQFCISQRQRGVLRFVAETGETSVLADSIEGWAALLLENYHLETGWTLAHEWQLKYGALQFGQRLQPKIPFALGGAFSLENLWVGNATEGMRFKGDLSQQLKNLPDGTQVRLKVKS